MLMNPYISTELARERQREMLAHAERQRLARRMHAGPGTAQSGQRPRQWARCLRSGLRAAGRLRALSGK